MRLRNPNSNRQAPSQDIVTVVEHLYNGGYYDSNKRLILYCSNNHYDRYNPDQVQVWQRLLRARLLPHSYLGTITGFSVLLSTQIAVHVNHANEYIIAGEGMSFTSAANLKLSKRCVFPFQAINIHLVG